MTAESVPQEPPKPAREWKEERATVIARLAAIAKSPQGDRRVIHGRNLRECIEEEDSPGTIRHTSIHKAKGLDSKAVIPIGMPPHKNLATDYEHFSWFMAVSRARQLLAILEST